MDRGIYPILSGALAQEQRIQVFAHNIANVNTTAYKQDEPLFQALIARSLGGMAPAGSGLFSTQPVSMPTGPAERVFVAQHGMNTVYDAGRLRSTGNLLDLAIQGPGFFEIQTPEGIRYTRSGVFHLNERRQLLTDAGYSVMGKKGAVTLPPGEVQIDASGEISVNRQTVGKLKVVEFPASAMPRKVSGGLFAGGNARVMKAPSIMTGHIEESNVNPLSEMVKLIQGMRTYESAQKMIQAFDRMAELTVQEVGRVL